jgi:hypothetical protein
MDERQGQSMTPEEMARAQFVTKDSGVREEFTSGMKRDTGNKLRYDLIYAPFLKRWAALMQRGAEKYGPRNWEKASGTAEYERFKASAWRHFMAAMDGETDEDHLVACAFNLAGMMYLQNKGVK